MQRRDGPDRAESGQLSWLVVVGASAGGIEALSGLLAPITPEFPAPIVVAQHTQPTRTSHLAEILRARTSAQVVEVERREKLLPGTVYLVPSGHHLSITDHRVEATPARGDRPSPSIDRLLETAAETFGERLIAVILSGMGSDGVEGAAAVKTNGGTVIIQNPETAAHPAMPRALPPTLVDFVANTDRMGELVVELVTAPQPDGSDDERLLRSFLEQVRDRTGIDFSAYKQPTIMRRLQRRMVATASPRLRDYVRYVQKHPEEYQRLSSAFLIKVTQFFRDADLFTYLRDTLIPLLVEQSRSSGRELRLWSAGCATGEEAYSLAILLAEALGEDLGSFTVRIFATDLDEEAIAYARRGIYPETAVSTLPRDLVDKYFIRVGDDYEVVKAIRQVVVFGQHDLGQRAPFPRIDLALCRNVLIYFTSELQKRSLQLFAFSLREGGFLVLGKAESATPYAEHFVLEQPRLKIYRRAGDRVLIPPARIRDSAPAPSLTRPVRREPAWATTGSRVGREPVLDTRPERGDQVLAGLRVGVAVVNRQYEILSINGAGRRLLGIHGTGIGGDLVHLSGSLQSDDVRGLLDGALRGETRALVRGVRTAVEGGEGTDLEIVAQPYRVAAGEPIERVLLTVFDVSDRERAIRDVALEATRTQEDLVQLRERMSWLVDTNRELAQANEELSSSNSLLRTANEELLVANEEVQAATEEVETLNEELQATNEELETLNEELQATVEELNTTNDDLEARSTELADTAASLQEQRERSETERMRLAAILDGMSEAVLMVDRSGKAVATNRVFDAQFGGPDRSFTPEDEAGRQLPADEWPQRRAARSEAFSMAFTLVGADGQRRWYEATSSGGGREWGGVVVIRDITDRSLRHLQERFIAAASHELQTPIAALHTFLQLVARGAMSGLDAETARYLAQALDQSRRLGELSRRLFDVSVARHGQLVSVHDPVDLKSILADEIDSARALSPGASIEASLGRPTRVLGDDLRLRQLFGNVLGNALLHGASKAPVEVELGRDGREAVVSIADRGPGVPDAVRRSLFTPFASRDAEPGPGLGLGLYISHEIVTGHGGTIVLRDRTGGGTEVVIRLPLAAAGTRAAGAPATRRRKATTRRGRS